MKILKVITFATVTASIALLSSCGCCTSESPVPPLRPAPNFSTPVIEYNGK